MDLHSPSCSDIHPLALEDVLQQRSTQSRSKADYYSKHLFLRVLRHCYAPDDEFETSVLRPFAGGSPNHNITGLPRSASPMGFDTDDQDDSVADDETTTVDGKSPSTGRFSTRKGFTQLAYNAPKKDLERGATSQSTSSTLSSVGPFLS